MLLTESLKGKNTVTYTQLPWFHLGQVIRLRQISLRIVINQLPLSGSVIAHVFAGHDPLPQSAQNLLIVHEKKACFTEKQVQCLKLLSRHSASGRNLNQALISAEVFGEFLSIVGDISIELKDRGPLIRQSNVAQIHSLVTDAEGIKGLNFCIKVEGQDENMEWEGIWGNEVVFVLDSSLRLYRLQTELACKEVRALLSSPALPIEGLVQGESKQTFSAIAKSGAVFDDLAEIAIEPEFRQLVIRALIVQKTGAPLVLRVHLVNQFSAGSDSYEIEIAAKDLLSQVFLGERTQNGKAEVCFWKRDNRLEIQARQWLASLNFQPASLHAGYEMIGEAALTAIVALKQSQLPEGVILEQDSLPEVIHLAESPTLNISAAEGSHFIGNLQFGAPKIDLAWLMSEGEKGKSLALYDENTLFSFSPKLIEVLRPMSRMLKADGENPINRIDRSQLFLLKKMFPEKFLLSWDQSVERSAQMIDEALSEDLPLEVYNSALRPYQQTAVTWLWQLYKMRIGGLLADDMGLGKTFVSLSLINLLKKLRGFAPSLVVAPTTVLDVWLLECKKHAPDLKISTWHGSARENIEGLAADSDILVTSYAILRRDIAGPLSKVNFRCLILDEAQNVKNHRTENWKAAAEVRAEQKIALTGTPIENGVQDLWSILDLLNPNILGGKNSFNKQYLAPISLGDMRAAKELKLRVNPITLRRTKQQVETELPLKIESTIKCDMGPKQRALYTQIVQLAHNEMQLLLTRQGGVNAQMPILAMLTRLRQICCDPRLLEEEYSQEENTSAKLELLRETVIDCLAMGRRIVIYSQFVKMQEYIHAMLAEIGYPDMPWLHGGSKKRGEIVERFQTENGPPIILVSLKAGGTGITLTRADTVIYFDPWWNPAVLDQAADRSHRIGQTKTVHVIKLICRDSIEERVVELADKKRTVARDLLMLDKPGQKTLSIDEITHLLTSEYERTIADGGI